MGRAACPLPRSSQGDGEAQLLAPGHVVHGPGLVPGGAVLGDLQGEPAVVKPELLREGLERLGKIRAGDEPPVKVAGQAQPGQIGALPALEQAASVAEHGAVQLVDGPGGIEQGNICPGGQQTPAGVLPAGEDLRPHDALAVGVHDALADRGGITPGGCSLRLALLPGQLPGGGDTAERGLILRDRQHRRHRCQRPFCTEIKPTKFGRPAKRVTGGVWT